MNAGAKGSARVLVFGVDGFPNDLADQTAGLDLVSMTALLTLRSPELQTGDSRHLPTLDFLTILSLQDELESLWLEVSKGQPDVTHHKHEFVWLFSNLLFWRHRVRALLTEMRPALVLIPSRCQTGSLIVSSHADLLKWALYQVINEETRAVERRTFIERIDEDSSATSALGGKSQLRPSSQTLMSILRRLKRNISSSAWLKPLGELYSLAISPMNLFLQRRRRRLTTVLVIAQRTKVEALLKQPIKGCRVRFVESANFHDLLLPKGRRQVSSAFCTGAMGAQEALLEFFWQSVQKRRNAGEAIVRAAMEDWQVLVTDAGQDPFVRNLADIAMSIGKQVAVVPEGAISYAGALRLFGDSGLFITDPRVTRFVLNEIDRTYWISRGTPSNQVMISGFLGDTRRPIGLLRAIQKRQLTKAIAQIRHRTTVRTVLLAFDAFFWNWEFARFGVPTQGQMLEQLTKVLERLLDSGHFVLAKTRDETLTREMQQKFAGRAVLFTNTIPWTVLLERSSVAIVRDSSIGWETLSLGKPVVVWNLSDYPAFAEVTLEDLPQEWMRTVRDLKDLPDQIEGLVMSNQGVRGVGGTRDRSRPPVTARLDVVERWLGGFK